MDGAGTGVRYPRCKAQKGRGPEMGGTGLFDEMKEVRPGWCVGFRREQRRPDPTGSHTSAYLGFDSEMGSHGGLT